MLKIGGLTPCTAIDYPGELAAVIFCQGCPWRCNYCHNPHLLEPGMAGRVGWDEVARFLKRRRGLLDAVVFSGGEPTMQWGLADAILAVKRMGFKAGLHTAGPYPERLSECLPLLDWVGMDIKAPFGEYERITGVPDSGAAVRMSAEALHASGVRHQFRTTLNPLLPESGYLDAMKNMVAGEWGSELVVQPMNLSAGKR